MRLQILPFSFTSGLFSGVPLALVTFALMIMGTPGRTISRLGDFLPGYEFSYLGGLVGFGWLFLGGMAFGGLVSLLYNLFLGGDAVPLPDRPRKRAPRAPRKPKHEALPIVPRPDDPPAPAPAEKPAKKRPERIRTPKQAPAPKRKKTPYPGKIGAYRDDARYFYNASA